MPSHLVPSVSVEGVPARDVQRESPRTPPSDHREPREAAEAGGQPVCASKPEPVKDLRVHFGRNLRASLLCI